MKGQGGIRRFIAMATGMIGRLKFWGRTRTMPDPILRDPYTRQRKGSRQPGKTSSIGSSAPACVPGTITYHDKLVRHFGHRFANKFRRHYIESRKPDGPLLNVPSAANFAASPPWAFLK